MALCFTRARRQGGKVTKATNAAPPENGSILNRLHELLPRPAFPEPLLHGEVQVGASVSAQLNASGGEPDPPKFWHGVVVQAIPRALVVHANLDAPVTGFYSM